MARISLLLVLSLFGFALLVGGDPITKPMLYGVTTLYTPFASYNQDRKLQGFVVDLMDRIADKVGVEYRLSPSEDGAYGFVNENGTWNGMIGQLVNKRADFAIADLTITDQRKQAVDFTEPFMTSHLAALVRSKDAQGYCTLGDLVRASFALPADSPQRFAFSTITNGAINSALRHTRNPVGMQISRWIEEHPTYQVRSYSEGHERAEAGLFALLMYSSTAEFVAGSRCNLTVLQDDQEIYDTQFAIALPKGSSYLEPFSRAIRELKDEIGELKAKHWVNRCAAKVRI